MINTSQFKAVEGWHEITLETATKLSELTIPDGLDRFDLFKHIDDVKRVVVLLSDADEQTVNLIYPDHLVTFFANHLYKYVVDLHRPTPESYTPQLIESFEHNGVKYLMPKSLIIDDETLILQHSQDVKRFIEASNLFKRYSELKDDGIKVMATFIASVVKREEDEEFNDVIVMNRAKQFSTLPMSVVWEVFFCISALIHKSLLSTLQSISHEIDDQESRMGKVLKRLDTRLGRLRSRRAELLERWRVLTA